MTKPNTNWYFKHQFTQTDDGWEPLSIRDQIFSSLTEHDKYFVRVPIRSLYDNEMSREDLALLDIWTNEFINTINNKYNTDIQIGLIYNDNKQTFFEYSCRIDDKDTLIDIILKEDLDEGVELIECHPLINDDFYSYIAARAFVNCPPGNKFGPEFDELYDPDDWDIPIPEIRQMLITKYL